MIRRRRCRILCLMVVTVLKMGKATLILIQVVLIQVKKELVVIRAVLKVVRKELVGMRVALTVVLKGLVAIKRVQVVIRMAQAQITAALMALREMTPVETMKIATLIWTMETMAVTVGIRMTEAETLVRTEALMVTWDPVRIPMETPMVVLVKMETVTPVKKGTLMRKWRLG
mgnify:CR=1 FL=1